MDNTSNKSKKIRKGDKVVAIAGNYRGQTGTVLSCTAKGAIVQGLNVRKKHVKPSQQNQGGGIIEMEKPITISNLKVCTADEKPVKLKVRVNSKGERELVYQVDSKDVLHRSLKKS
ncbi:MAG: 50S ribosomal protein L24 [Parachlamydiaceae bacterium]